MTLPDEQPLTDAEIDDIDRTVLAALCPIEKFIQDLRSTVASPATFLQLPHKQDQLQEIIDSYAAIYDLLPLQLFTLRMDAMIVYRDQLLDLESHPALQGNPSPFTTVEFEISDRGCPRIAISRGLVEALANDVGLTNKEVATLLGCSLSTIERRLREWGIRKRQPTLEDDELEQVVTALKEQAGPFQGERAICGMLRAMGHWVPRSAVREVIRTIDPQGVDQRWRQAIFRRVYSVPFVNSLWHIDGYHKLIRWKFVIHGGIDGKSRLIVFMAAADNNRARTVGAVFREATEKWGWPSRVRADWGGENVEVKEMMEEVRGPGRASFLAGPSTHNQRIERLWRDLFAWTAHRFYLLFSLMESQGILDTSNEVHLWALHLVFLPRINRALELFVQTWNNHKISSQQSKTPHQLYLRGLIEARQMGFFLNPQTSTALDDTHENVTQFHQDFTLYGAEVVGAQRDRRNDDPHVPCDPPAQTLLETAQVSWILEQLHAMDENADFYGTEKYIQVLSLVDDLTREHVY